MSYLTLFDLNKGVLCYIVWPQLGCPILTSSFLNFNIFMDIFLPAHAFLSLIVAKNTVFRIRKETIANSDRTEILELNISLQHFSGQIRIWQNVFGSRRIRKQC